MSSNIDNMFIFDKKNMGYGSVLLELLPFEILHMAKIVLV